MCENMSASIVYIFFTPASGEEPSGVMTVDTAVHACFDVIHILRTSNFLKLLSGSQTQTGCDFVWLWSSLHIHTDTLCLIRPDTRTMLKQAMFFEMNNNE